MSERAKRYAAFSAAAIVAFVVIVEGLDVFARVRIGDQSLSEASSETLHYSLVEPVGTLFSFLPFAAIAWICASLARVSRSRAIGIMIACLALFALMYYGGYMDSQKYMLQRMWTAATLAVGLIPFKSIPIVLVAFGLRFVLARNHASSPA